MPMMLLLLPLQRCEISEGGPPCKSMPLVRLGLTLFSTLFVTSSAASYKITLPLWFWQLPSTKRCTRVKCVPGDPATMCPVLFKGSRPLPAVIGLVLRNLSYVLSLSCKAVLSAMLAVLCCVYRYGIVCPS